MSAESTAISGELIHEIHVIGRAKILESPSGLDCASRLGTSSANRIAAKVSESAVIPEAMASGCAIASCVPLEFHGVRFRSGATGEMIEGVRRLMEDDAWFEECSRANLRAARFYSWSRYTEELLALYEQALGNRRRGASAT